MATVWLDAQPFLDALEARGGVRTLLFDRYKDRTDKDAHRLARAAQRAATTGVLTPAQADHLCINLLGLNPALVFGPSWWDTVDEPDEVAEAWLAEAS